VDSHEQAVREKGLSEETVMAAIRIAATIHALAAVVGADEAAGATA
jgi:alkyl hydroperoxide reductase subunit D